MGVKRRKGLCKYKTSKGNVYSDYSEAKKIADGWSKKWRTKGIPGKGLRAYYCEFCGKWHIGKFRDKLRQYQYYIVPKQYSVIGYLENWLTANINENENKTNI